jgi:hypothetical protein
MVAGRSGLRLAMTVTLVSFGLVGCGFLGLDEGSERTSAVSGLPEATVPPFFAPADADTVAHAMLPSAVDLGTGWDLIAEDAFNDADDPEFDALLATEPACEGVRELEQLAALDAVMGSAAAQSDMPAGRASIEFENLPSRGYLPLTVEIAIEVEQTLSKIQGGWPVMKQVIEGDELQICLTTIMAAGFESDPSLADLAIEVRRRSASAIAPHGGASIGWGVALSAPDVDVDMAFETYMWPYGNALVTVDVTGDVRELDGPTVRNLLSIIQARVEAQTPTT